MTNADQPTNITLTNPSNPSVVVHSTAPSPAVIVLGGHASSSVVVGSPSALATILVSGPSNPDVVVLARGAPGPQGQNLGTVVNIVNSTGAPVYTAYPFYASFGTTIYINPVPSASVELDETMRLYVDASSAVSASVTAYVTSSGPSGSWLTVNYSRDGVTWSPLTSVSLMTTGTVMAAYSPIPAPALTGIQVQLVTTNGDNATTAELGNVSLGLVQSAAVSAVTASYAMTASVLLGSIQSASYASVAQTLLGSILSASYALTASYAMNGGGSSVSASYASTASVALAAITASYAPSVPTASYAIGADLAMMAHAVPLVPLISGTRTANGTQLTSSYAVPSASSGAFVLLDPNTGSIPILLPSASLSLTFNVRHIGVSGVLTVMNTSNQSQSALGPGMYNTYICDGTLWWVY